MRKGLGLHNRRSALPPGWASLDLNFVNDQGIDPLITFTRASTGTFFNSAGVLTSAAINEARFDYNPATLAARGLLIEEQRTNSLPRSEEFSDASWTKAGATVTADSTTAPSGTTTADTLTEDTSTGQHRVYRTTSGTTNTNPYTVSFFAKASTRSRVYVGLVEGTTFARSGYAVFDLSAGTVVSAGGGGGGATGGSATIQNVGNGWYRCTYTLTLGGTDTSIFCDINLVSTGTTISYTGNGTGAIFLWGAQLEAGAFPTSYIPTTTTALTRSADVASVNTLAPWYNSTQGTLFAQVSLITVSNDASRFVAALSDGTTSNYIGVFRQTDQQPVGQVQTSAGTQAALGAGAIWTTTASRKLALSYATNDFKFCTNGGTVFTDTAGTVPTVTQLQLGVIGSGLRLNGWLERVTFYPRVLSSAELQAITA